jgi:hypothetical protein
MDCYCSDFWRKSTVTYVWPQNVTWFVSTFLYAHSILNVSEDAMQEEEH